MDIQILASTSSKFCHWLKQRFGASNSEKSSCGKCSKEWPCIFLISRHLIWIQLFRCVEVQTCGKCVSKNYQVSDWVILYNLPCQMFLKSLEPFYMDFRDYSRTKRQEKALLVCCQAAWKRNFWRKNEFYVSVISLCSTDSFLTQTVYYVMF